MTECRNPACPTDHAPLSWADPDFCCDACRQACRSDEPRPLTDPPLHAELMVNPPFVESAPSDAFTRVHPWEPGPAGTPAVSGVPAALHQWLGARWSDGEIASGPDTPARPAPVAVDGLNPVPAGAESYQAADGSQGTPWAYIPIVAPKALGGISVAEATAGVEALRAALNREPRNYGGVVSSGTWVVVGDPPDPAPTVGLFAEPEIGTSGGVNGKFTSPATPSRRWWARLLRRSA